MRFSKHTFLGYSQILLDVSAEIQESKDTPEEENDDEEERTTHK